MHKLHSGYTISLPVNPASFREIIALLGNFSKPCFSFLKLCHEAESTLFISGVILPSQLYGNEMLPTTLVWAVTYCGPMENHELDFIRPAHPFLVQLFSNCLRFPVSARTSVPGLIQFLRKNMTDSVFNSNFHGISKVDVCREKSLRSDLENYVDTIRSNAILLDLPALVIKKKIELEIVRWGGKYHWTRYPDRRYPLQGIYLNRHRIIPRAAAAALLLASLVSRKSYFRVLTLLYFLASFVGILLLISYRLSKENHLTAGRIRDSRMRRIEATQLRPILNEMTAAGPLKKGRLRRVFFRFFLKVIRIVFEPLINIPTVSSIRWTLVNDSKRLVFLSNYANTTDFYVRDFLVGKSPQGINFMFTHGEGFPTANYLFRGGIADDPEGYMNAVHQGQQLTRFWYAHDHNLTADVIKINHKIRNGLFEPMSEEYQPNWPGNKEGSTP